MLLLHSSHWGSEALGCCDQLNGTYSSVWSHIRLSTQSAPTRFSHSGKYGVPCLLCKKSKKTSYLNGGEVEFMLQYRVQSILNATNWKPFRNVTLQILCIFCNAPQISPSSALSLPYLQLHNWSRRISGVELEHSVFIRSSNEEGFLKIKITNFVAALLSENVWQIFVN